MINKKIMRMHFSKRAVSYDEFAVVQKKMALELFKKICLAYKENLDKINMLDVGCGTGYLTERLIKHYTSAKITAIDIAPGMIEFVSNKFRNENVKFICSDIEEDEIVGEYDLIVSNATFQWFNHLEKTILKLVPLLTKNGVLAFSTFGSMTFNELHQSYKIAKEKLNIKVENLPGHQFFSYEDLCNLCKRIFPDSDNFSYEIASTENYEFEYFNTARDFFKTIQKTGANNSNKEWILNPSLMKELMTTYENSFRENNKIKVTYHCIYITIKRK